jgi:hypothetical protein
MVPIDYFMVLANNEAGDGRAMDDPVQPLLNFLALPRRVDEGDESGNSHAEKKRDKKAHCARLPKIPDK